MIVVDTNVLAYAVMSSGRTAAIEALVARDQHWVAPDLWRRELRNVLATAMRVRGLPLDQALAAFTAAERLVQDVAAAAPLEECLRVAAAGRVSAWDAEFVCAAMALGVPLVSADRKLARAFPDYVMPLDTIADGTRA